MTTHCLSQGVEVFHWVSNTFQRKLYLVINSYRNFVRQYLGKLLEELDKEYPNAVTTNYLRENIASDVDYTILEATDRDLIHYPTYNNMKSVQSMLGNGVYDKYVISSRGFEILNQIRIKETIEQLDKSIQKFNDSSDKSAKLLNKYTLILVCITLFLASLTIISALAFWFDKKYGEDAPFVIIFLFAISFVIIIAVFYNKIRNPN